MRRREFIAFVGSSLAGWPVARAAVGQTADDRISCREGTPTSHGQWVAAFVRRLRELGWIEGRTITIEYRWVEGRNERFAEGVA
jgi:putative ABC transport system substrate-binding protein